MLSDETIERYRQMSVGERLDMTFRSISENTQSLGTGSPEQVTRRYELLRLTNNSRNERILSALAESQDESRLAFMRRLLSSSRRSKNSTYSMLLMLLLAVSPSEPTAFHARHGISI